MCWGEGSFYEGMLCAVLCFALLTGESPTLLCRGGGSFDEGDPYTTNVYLGNIAPDVDELILMREFGR